MTHRTRRTAVHAALGTLLTLAAAALGGPAHAAVTAPAAATAYPRTTAASPGAATSDTVRYAYVRRCTENGTATPCGPWRLRMRSGRTVRLAEARVLARTAKGEKVRNRTAPFAISGDGTTVAYFREDGRLVVRKVAGGAPLVLAYTPPKGSGTDLVTLYLSNTGGRLAVEAGDDPERRPTVVYDTSTGAVALRLPGTLAFQGFGGDGESVLAAGSRGDRITRLVAFDAGGEPLLDIRPPQVVADNAPYALSPDGGTVAFVGGGGTDAALGLYDPRTGTLRRIPVRIPDDDLVDALGWSGETQVTVRLSRIAARSDAIRVLEVDTATGTARTRESYTIGDDVFGTTPDA